MDLPLPVRVAAERGIDALLKLDPDTRVRLDALDGKVVAIQVTAPNVRIVVSIVDRHIHLIGALDDPADTSLTGSLAALRSLADSNDALHRGDVTVEGDLSLAQQLKDIVAALDPDWEELLSPLIGDTLVHRAGIAGQQVGQWMQRTREALAYNTEDYLQEEAQLLAPNARVRDFCLEVDELRAAVDRLEARLTRLEKARKPESGGSTC